MTEIPKAPVVRLAKSIGAERISEEAAIALTEGVEEYAKKLAEVTKDLADHADRKTLQAVDVELALKHF